MKKTSNFAKNQFYVPLARKVVFRTVTLLGTLILILTKVGGGSNCMEKTEYLSPAVQALELYAEGVLCSSSGTELLEENEGIW